MNIIWRSGRTTIQLAMPSELREHGSKWLVNVRLVVTLHIDRFYQQENAKSNSHGCPLMARGKTTNCREIMPALGLGVQNYK